MSENILSTAPSPSVSDLGGDSSLPQGSDLEGRAQPTDTSVGRLDPIGTSAAQVTHRKKFPLFSVLLLIVLSIVSVIAVYLFIQVRQLSMSQPVPSPSPSPIPSTDPTSNWQTYTNNEYGFAIKYPSEAKVRSEQPPSNDRMFLFAIDSPNAVFDRMFKSGDYSFGISIQTQKNFLEISDYLNFQKEHNTYKEVIPTSINNVSGYKFKTDGYPTTNFHYQGFVAKKEDLYITINYFSDQDLKIFDQFLSTFKFTETPKLGDDCAGPKNILCGEGLACKLNVLGNNSRGGVCVNESETNP